MDLDELKTAWQNLSIKVEQLEEDNRRTAAALATGRAKTAQNELARLYRKSAYLGLALPLLAPLIVAVLDLPLWLAIIYAFFGIIMSIAGFLFSEFIADTDFISVPVVQAITQSLTLKKYSGRLQICGAIMATFLIICFMVVLCSQSDMSVLFGFLAGLALGLPIAFRKIRKQRRLIREIREALADLDE